MKTLNKYIVAGALYENETGPEAQVGDQVKMYLDTEAHEDFPEYIFGVIQHPIVKVNCDSATSYSIEYDEADLDGVVNYLVVDDVISVELVTQLVAAIEALFQSGTFSNSTGNTTITVPAGCDNYTVYGTITGSAGTRNVVLDTANASDGCQVIVVLELPTTASIVVNFRNATTSGTILDTLTTDTSGDNATAEFGFTTVWNKLQSQYPN